MKIDPEKGHTRITADFPDKTVCYAAVAANAEAVKDGGPILFVAGCTQGAGNPEFAQTLKTYRTCPEDLGKTLTQSFHMPSYEAFRLMDLLHRFDVSLVSDLPGDQVRYLGFFPVNDIQAWTTALTGIGYVIPFGETFSPGSAQQPPPGYPSGAGIMDEQIISRNLKTLRTRKNSPWRNWPAAPA